MSFSKNHKNNSHSILTIEVNWLTKQIQKQDTTRVALHNPPIRKRNRAVQFLLLPAVVVLGIVGWSLTWIGSSKKPTKDPRK